MNTFCSFCSLSPSMNTKHEPVTLPSSEPAKVETAIPIRPCAIPTSKTIIY